MLSERDLFFISGVDAVDHAGVIAFAGSPASPIGAAHYVRTEDPEVAEWRLRWSTAGSGAASVGC